MEADKDTITVFTARSPDRIVKEGGSQAWVLNPTRAKLCKWLVCCQNLHNPDHEFSDATEPHGSGFLVGKISAITRSPEYEDDPTDRWLIEISEYARIAKPDVWAHWRNPVRYTTLQELGIDPARLEFKAMPQAAKREVAPKEEVHAAGWPPTMLTIAEAKKALAATFGVKPDAVEIVIRG